MTGSDARGVKPAGAVAELTRAERVALNSIREAAKNYPVNKDEIYGGFRTSVQTSLAAAHGEKLVELRAPQLANDGLFIQSVTSLGANRGLELRVLPDARVAKLDPNLSPEAIAARLIVDEFQAVPLKTDGLTSIRRTAYNGVFSFGMHTGRVAAEIERLLPGTSSVTVTHGCDDGDGIGDIVTLKVDAVIQNQGRLPRVTSLR